MSESIPVLVTTAHRGVFFGYTDKEKIGEPSITLTNCRNCIYWCAEVGGFLGLAANGPVDGCKIGTIAPLPVLLRDITSVSHVTEKAAKSWMEF